MKKVLTNLNKQNKIDCSTNPITLFWRELCKICIPVIATILLLSAVSSYIACTSYKDYDLSYDLEAWELGTEWLSIFFPIFVTAPICWNLCSERKKEVLYDMSRQMKIGYYLLIKWGAYALGAFLIMFIPNIVTAAVALYGKPPIAPVESPWFMRTFLQFYVNNPFGYALCLSAWKGFIGVTMMSLGFIIALYGENVVLAVMSPFVYGIVEGIILSLFSLEKYRIHISFEPSIIAPYTLEVAELLIAPAILLAFTLLLWFVLAKLFEGIKG